MPSSKIDNLGFLEKIPGPSLYFSQKFSEEYISILTEMKQYDVTSNFIMDKFNIKILNFAF